MKAVKHGQKTRTVFAKRCILDISQDSEYLCRIFLYFCIKGANCFRETFHLRYFVGFRIRLCRMFLYFCITFLLSPRFHFNTQVYRSLSINKYLVLTSTPTPRRSSRPEVFYKKGVLRNFTKFTGKHLCQSLFF